jgi:hypothetical protein
MEGRRVSYKQVMGTHGDDGSNMVATKTGTIMRTLKLYEVEPWGHHLADSLKHLEGVSGEFVVGETVYVVPIKKEGTIIAITDVYEVKEDEYGALHILSADEFLGGQRRVRKSRRRSKKSRKNRAFRQNLI